MATKQLTQFLIAPSKVASALDWKRTSGSVLSLKIGRDLLTVNLAHHPSIQEECRSVDPIPIKYRVKNNRKELDVSVTDVLQDLVQENRVCGFIVDWPLQKEGRMGASCGRVLHVLDLLLEAQVLSQSRRFCLWDGEHVPIEMPDRWGRCSVYGRKQSDKAEHIVSRDQYSNTTESLVSDMWYDFSRTHWPELYDDGNGAVALSSNSSRASGDYHHISGEWLEHYEREGTYLQASATRYDRRMISNIESTK